MKSLPPRARLLRSILLSIALASGLSACKTVDVSLYAPTCFGEMVRAAGLDKPTDHAPLPADDSAGAWVATANAEGGQLDKANASKSAVIGIGDTCEKWQQEAKAKAEKKPWYRRVF